MALISDYNISKVIVIRMTACEYHNLKLCYSCFRYEFGEMLVARSDKGICFAGFITEERKDIDELKMRLPNADLLERCFENPFEKDECTLHLWGTDFQISVWNALLAIGKGCSATYSDIASAVGCPKAVRAVGTAVGKNPVAVVIPCHRIVCSDGKIGNYHYGSDIKRLLLKTEC